MSPVLRRLAVALPAVLLALVAGAAPAWAHTELESSSPAANSQVGTAPTSVSLTFSEDIAAADATVSVTGPGGTDYAAGPATGDGDTLTVPLRPLGAAGAYTVTYRVVSDDGHPVSGTVPFTLASPGPGAAAATSAAAAPSAAPTTAPQTTPTASSDDGGAPVWPWIVVAVVVIGAGVAFALRRSKA
ncbi:copper resistance CopC family protein [Pseudonocardia sp. ICBG601]|uniref:copper resistance CopC family protein n=1 Tax=Pseudonocardia sp. ICBG601 TaxID=2846759 RepID=UPI001CF683C1|nr:copper resistance CopC family protein [Pseudonocardia sp. ICBG601]